jgi:hypothetical protein
MPDASADIMPPMTVVTELFNPATRTASARSPGGAKVE